MWVDNQLVLYSMNRKSGDGFTENRVDLLELSLLGQNLYGA